MFAVLRDHAGRLPVRTVEADLLTFRAHLGTKVDLVLSMGDTLTHLPAPSSVDQLSLLVSESLNPGGRFIASFRDDTAVLERAARFIPVRSGQDRIPTCFPEYAPDSVAVHDVLHEREGSTWRLRVSAYRKQRLSPAWVSTVLQSMGFTVRLESGLVAWFASSPRIDQS